MTATSSYVGRFAPSPSGPLHFGSLLAATASYLQARRAGGQWLLRIEDIDPPRQQAGATDLILQALDDYGFRWDGDIIYQSAHRARHLSAVEQLLTRNLAYRCGCSRRDLADALTSPLGTIYPGTCRHGSDTKEFAIRVLTDDQPLSFVDALQGPQRQKLQSESGDFVVLRRDGLVAYNLAVVIDDADEGITEVVRGIDLLDSTPRHNHLQRLLRLPTPRYCHIPVAENSAGQKLSKLTGASGVPLDKPQIWLIAALQALGQAPDAALARARVSEVWDWAIAHWQPQVLSGLRAIGSDAAPLAAPQNGLS